MSSLSGHNSWKLVRVYAIDRGHADLEVPWHDEPELHRRIARSFNIDTIDNGPQDLVQGERTGLILRGTRDVPVASFL